MNTIASPGQIKASFLRWALVLVPLVMLLGFVSGKLAQSGPDNAWFADLVKPGIYPPPEVQGRLYTISPADLEYERLRTRAWTRVKTGR